MLRVGLIGSGFMAQTHLDRYSAMDDVDVAAVATKDSAPEFIEDNELDADAFDDAEAMMESGVDAVDVCTPTPTHRNLVEAAATRGLAVFCEKPLALTLEDANAMAAAVDEAGVTAMVGHVLRFFPAYREIRESIDDGQVGTPGTVRARRVSPFPDWADWYGQTDRSGGVFQDLAIHEFDFCRWAVGDVERVFARLQESDRTHRGHATLTFENGAVGYVEAGWDRPSGGDLDWEFEIAGDEGLLEYDSTDRAPLTIETSDDETPVPPPVARDGYRRELEAFVSAVTAGTEPPVSVHDAVEAVRIAVASRRSAERGEPVALAEVIA